MEQNDVLRTRELLRRRREAHREALRQEAERLTIAAKELGGAWKFTTWGQYAAPRSR
jgi:predicted Ser/Thr protein kinase